MLFHSTTLLLDRIAMPHMLETPDLPDIDFRHLKSAPFNRTKIVSPAIF